MTLSPKVLYIIKMLKSYGFAAFAVGGCVRDMMLGNSPKDWDLTTSATPQQVKKVFDGESVIETGLRHGTVTLVLDGENFEITTFRSDGAYENHRAPKKVRFSTNLEDDLSRRDFTINAMAYSRERGLVDLFDGQKHLREQKIVCVGDSDVRFEEDGLRILRALRFASVLGFDIDDDVAQSIYRKTALLSHISKERITTEFSKLIVGKNACAVLMRFSSVFEFIIPEISLENVPAIAAAPAELTTRMALLFCGDGGRSAQRALQNLRFDNKTAEDIITLVTCCDTHVPKTAPGIKWLLCTLGHRNFVKYLDIQLCRKTLTREQYNDSVRLASIIIAEKQCYQLSELAVNGRDLLSLGVPNGKAVGDSLNLLLEEVINGRVENDKQALLRYIKTHRV